MSDIDLNARENLYRKLPKMETYTQNRELSWLKFNERVLEEATIKNVPIYERLKFIAIFVSNLKEFFMVRIGSLSDLQKLKDPPRDSRTNMTPEEQHEACLEAVRRLYGLKDNVFFDVENELRKDDIQNVSFEELTEDEKKYVLKLFKSRIEPILSPMVIARSHPFPFLENNELYITCELKSPVEEKGTFGILNIPETLPKFFKLGAEGTRYILTENIILNFLDKLYTEFKIEDKCVISATRNTDLTIDDEEVGEEEYVTQMRNILKKRKRLGCVRMTSSKELSPRMKKFFMANLDIKENEIFVTKTPLNMDYAFKLSSIIDEETLKKVSYPPFKGGLNSAIKPTEPIISQVMDKDFLFFYPYDSMEQFIKILEEAANDPDVLSIKITIYRLSKNSKVVQNLVRAAENGKDVTVLMELRARFDEKNNIDYSEELFNAGCNVLYGTEGFKVHSKICLITKRSKSGEPIYITQIGTGNYNESTSKLYTDISFVTSDKAIGEDATQFFKNMCLGKLDGVYKKLLQSPSTVRSSIIDMIFEEIEKGAKGRIFMKMNSFTDREVIRALALASMMGVQIRLMIRGICSIVPGIQNVTENIEVRSIVGRFLEHSRIYKFGEGSDEKIYIGSADMMTRNTIRRVEILTPIEAPYLKNRLNGFIERQWKDTENARRLKNDGQYDIIYREVSEVPFNSHKKEMEISMNGKYEEPVKLSLIEKITKFLRDEGWIR